MKFSESDVWRIGIFSSLSYAMKLQLHLIDKYSNEYRRDLMDGNCLSLFSRYS